MVNLGDLINTVQHNCHISDARYAGNYSMCVFLLKMREYYRWENDYALTDQLPRDDLGNWLVEREQSWQEIETDDYKELPLESGSIDPFEAETINQTLIPTGYVYSSGYGLFLKPHFFLGKLLRQEQQDGVSILVSSCEYARDLVAPPAMALGNSVYIRQESVRRYMWEKVEEWRMKKRPDTPMGRALACYGDNTDLDTLLDELTDNEMATMIAHEIGEARAGRELGPGWEEMISAFPGTKVEFLARAVRDNLADCLNTLPGLIEREDIASLHFYFGNLTGMRKAIFPRALAAYRQWVEDGSLKPLRQLCDDGKQHWRDTAGAMIATYQDKGKDAKSDIENMMCPMTL
jgi:hypothetical protein